MLSQWKIGSRITAGFAALLLLTGGLGLDPIGKPADVNAGAQKIVGDALPGVYYAGQLQFRASASFGLMCRHVISNDKGAITALAIGSIQKLTVCNSNRNLTVPPQVIGYRDVATAKTHRPAVGEVDPADGSNQLLPRLARLMRPPRRPKAFRSISMPAAMEPTRKMPSLQPTSRRSERKTT